MEDDELLNFPLRDLAVEDCVVCAWAPNSKIDLLMDIFKKQGFKYRTKLIEWVKINENN